MLRRGIRKASRGNVGSAIHARANPAVYVVLRLCKAKGRTGALSSRLPASIKARGALKRDPASTHRCPNFDEGMLSPSQAAPAIA